MSEENNEEITLQRDQTTQDFLTGLKEREELKSKLHEKERECNTLKGSIYDMTKKIEDLEKQLAEKNQNKEAKKRRPSSARKPKRPAQKKKEKGGKDGGLLVPAEVNNKDSHDNPFEDPEKLYQEIATRYPDVPLSTVLIAEKKFVEADLDRNGTIDSDELEKMLDLVSQQGGTGFLYTKKEIENIFRKIDLDKTNSIDFFECIEVLEMIRQNRIKDLPIASSMQQNKSAVCSIQ